MQRIQADIAAGRLIARGGLGKRATAAARVTSTSGSLTVEDPPSGDDWMKAGGFSIVEAPSKEAAVAEAKEILAAMGDGTIELIEVKLLHPAAR
jgi:hypothetical protein